MFPNVRDVELAGRDFTRIYSGLETRKFNLGRARFASGGGGGGGRNKDIEIPGGGVQTPPGFSLSLGGGGAQPPK